MKTMLFLLVVTALVTSAQEAQKKKRTCEPFQETDTLTYEYVKIERLHYYNISTRSVSPLENGDYPEFTDALMYCKTANGERIDLAENAGQCNNNEWVKEVDKPLSCPIFGCRALPENSAHRYEYFYQKAEAGQDKKYVIAPMDWSGKYTQHTLAKRYCIGLPKDSEAQDES